jgi:hypothetical protein
VGDFEPIPEDGDGPANPEPGCPRPFGDHALALRKRGLSVVPCVDEDGKAPKFKGFERKRLSAETVAKLARRYPEANVGLVGGLSNIVVVGHRRSEALRPDAGAIW